MSMTEHEAIKEVRFNMSRIGLKESSVKRVTEAREVAIQALSEIQQYKAIGTVEELQELKEKNTEKRFNIFESHGMRQFVCGCCDRPILITNNYCSFCGQKIDWQRKER